MLCLAAMVMLAASCGSGEQTHVGIESTDPTSTEATLVAEAVGLVPEGAIAVVPGSIASIETGITSTAAFDEQGLQHIRNDFNAWFIGDGRANTDVGAIDWDTQFVLSTIFDACDPVQAWLTISDGVEVDWEQGTSDCESLSPHSALFVVPRSVESAGETITFDWRTPFELIGAKPAERLAPVRTDGGIKPAGAYGYEGEEVNGAYFFESADDAAVFIIEGLDEEAYPEGLQAQTDVRTQADLVLVVLQDACSPTDFELTPTDAGYTHTKWEAPVDCAWAPPHAIVYAVPNENAGAPPMVLIEVLEEES